MLETVRDPLLAKHGQELCSSVTIVMGPDFPPPMVSSTSEFVCLEWLRKPHSLLLQVGHEGYLSWVYQNSSTGALKASDNPASVFPRSIELLQGYLEFFR